MHFLFTHSHFPCPQSMLTCLHSSVQTASKQLGSFPIGTQAEGWQQVAGKQSVSAVHSSLVGVMFLAGSSAWIGGSIDIGTCGLAQPIKKTISKNRVTFILRLCIQDRRALVLQARASEFRCAGIWIRSIAWAVNTRAVWSLRDRNTAWN